MLIALVMATISGVFMAVQGSLNTALGKIIGLLAATFAVQVIGAITAVLLLAMGLEHSKWNLLGKAPWYTYLGGVIGVAIIYLVVASIDRIGVAAATTAIIVGQVSMAALVDHFGWFGLESIPFNWYKGLGMGAMALGAWLLLHR